MFEDKSGITRALVARQNAQVTTVRTSSHLCTCRSSSSFCVAFKRLSNTDDSAWAITFPQYKTVNTLLLILLEISYGGDTLRYSIGCFSLKYPLAQSKRFCRWVSIADTIGLSVTVEVYDSVFVVTFHAQVWPQKHKMATHVLAMMSHLFLYHFRHF